MSDASIRDAAVVKLEEAISLLAGIAEPSPPGGTYGASLPARLPATSGTVRNVTTLSGLKAAIALGGDIRLGGSTITVGTDNGNNLSLLTSGTAQNPNQISGGKIIGRVLINSNYWKLKDLEITGATYDGIKIADGVNAHDIDIDNCWIHHVGECGILSALNTSSNIQVWNCLIEQVGQSLPTTSFLIHSIYTGGSTSNWTICNNIFRPRNGFGVHLYPRPANVICAGNLTEGGITRGGYAIRGATNVHIIGDIIKGSPTGAFEITSATAPGVTIDDCIEFNNVNGFWTAGYVPSGSWSNFLHVDPKLATNGTPLAGSPAINFVKAARYSLLPALDKAGNARVTADAGPYRFV